MSAASAAEIRADRDDSCMDELHAHVAMLHRLAAPLAGKGKLIVARFGEDSETGRKCSPLVRHFGIGDVAGMVDAIRQLGAERDRNLYIPLAVMRPDLPRGLKGQGSDVVAVLGVVGDFDDDAAADYEARLPLPPSYVLETSADRFQAASAWGDLNGAPGVAPRSAAWSGCRTRSAGRRRPTGNRRAAGREAAYCSRRRSSIPRSGRSGRGHTSGGGVIVRKGMLHRLARLSEASKRSAGLLSPAERDALSRLVEACVAAGGGPRPDEPKTAAMARGLGLSGPAELRQLLEGGRVQPLPLELRPRPAPRGAVGGRGELSRAGPGLPRDSTRRDVRAGRDGSGRAALGLGAALVGEPGGRLQHRQPMTCYVPSTSR